MNAKYINIPLIWKQYLLPHLTHPFVIYIMNLMADAHNYPKYWEEMSTSEFVLNENITNITGDDKNEMLAAIEKSNNRGRFSCYWWASPHNCSDDNAYFMPAMISLMTSKEPYITEILIDDISHLVVSNKYLEENTELILDFNSKSDIFIYDITYTCWPAASPEIIGKKIKVVSCNTMSNYYLNIVELYVDMKTLATEFNENKVPFNVGFENLNITHPNFMKLAEYTYNEAITINLDSVYLNTYDVATDEEQNEMALNEIEPVVLKDKNGNLMKKDWQKESDFIQEIMSIYSVCCSVRPAAYLDNASTIYFLDRDKYDKYDKYNKFLKSIGYGHIKIIRLKLNDAPLVYNTILVSEKTLLDISVSAGPDSEIAIGKLLDYAEPLNMVRGQKAKYLIIQLWNNISINLYYEIYTKQTNALAIKIDRFKKLFDDFGTFIIR